MRLKTLTWPHDDRKITASYKWPWSYDWCHWLQGCTDVQFIIRTVRKINLPVNNDVQNQRTGVALKDFLYPLNPNGIKYLIEELYGGYHVRGRDYSPLSSDVSSEGSSLLICTLKHRQTTGCAIQSGISLSSGKIFSLRWIQGFIRGNDD